MILNLYIFIKYLPTFLGFHLFFNFIFNKPYLNFLLKQPYQFTMLNMFVGTKIRQIEKLKTLINNNNPDK